MKKIAFLVILCVFILGTVAIAGCTKVEKVYVCASGRESPTKDTCGINKVAGIKKQEAESYAKNFVGAYFTQYGGKAQLVSSYLDPEKGDFFATFVVGMKDSEPYQTVVSVDGVTGKVNCTENCQYVK